MDCFHCSCIEAFLPPTFLRLASLFVGFAAQYVLKLALGVLVARGFDPMFYASFVLMSCVARAQLSSYASFLSKGDVALSLLLTNSTTIASVLVTPLLTGLFLGSVVSIDATAMSKSIFQVPKLHENIKALFLLHHKCRE
ncbi:unnamed protein product [Fraxinus pennsylvanica]|uniref:Uncharacterized protein n=1 Tax=Fraxinus pennsylvanica TaxID=56036 RepID=A0AAD1Z5D9_9LAMI|nr:unnamed protein product [Fraxinus pennsylvanica]